MTNAQAYYENPLFTDRNNFRALALGAIAIKLFTAVSDDFS